MLGHRRGLASAFGQDRLHEPRQGRGRATGAPRSAGRIIQPGDQLAAQLVENALGDHRRARDRRLQPAKLVDRAAQPAELRSEQSQGRRRLVSAGCQRHVRLETVASAADRRRPAIRRAARRRRLELSDVELHLARRRSFERPAQPASQLGIVGLPYPLALFEREQVDIATPEPKLDRARLARAAIVPGFSRSDRSVPRRMTS